MRKVLQLVTMALILWAGSALAIDLEAGLIQKSQNGVVYVTGGVGADQQQALNKYRNDHNLHITFAQRKTGDYLSNVHVNIADKDGKTLVDIDDAGPILLAKVDAGTYRISVRYNDAKQNKVTTVRNDQRRDLVFYW